MERLCLIWNKISSIYSKYLIVIFFLKSKINIFNLESLTVEKHKLSSYELTDFWHVGFSYKSNQYESILYSGMSVKIGIASKKAISEFLEAYIANFLLKKSVNNRNGMAVHTESDQSKMKAYQELIERDSFLMHFFVPELPVLLLREIINDNIHWYFYRLQSVDQGIAVVLSIKVDLHTKNSYLGLSASPIFNHDELIQASAQESVMLEQFWVSPKFYKGNSERKKENLMFPHLLAIGSENTFLWISNLRRSCVDKEKFSLPFLDFSVSQTNHYSNLEHVEFNNYFYSQYTHEDLLPLYFGEQWEQSKDRYINLLQKRKLWMSHWATHPLL